MENYFNIDTDFTEKILHLCKLETPLKGAVISEQGDTDCVFSLCNGININKEVLNSITEESKYAFTQQEYIKISNNLNYNINNRYLLNLDINQYDILEKFIFDTAIFHLNCNKDPSNNIHDYFIEFWIKTTPLLNNIHIDCDEDEREINNNYIYPTKSIITYLNDHSYPTIFTNIDIEKYKYKSFDKENNIKIIFPKKNTQVVFDGSKYHGEIKLNEVSHTDNMNERFIIAINIWKHKPKNIDFYESSLNVSNKIYNKTTILINISKINEKYSIDANKKLNDSLFNKLLYKNDISICDLFKKEILEGLTNKKYYIDIFDKSINNYEYNQPKLQSTLIIKDLENISSENIQYNNRFLQRFVYENFFSHDVCKWILFEVNLFVNKNGWNFCRHNNYSTVDIPLQVLNNVSKYCLYAFTNLFKKIFKSYCISENYIADIKDMFIVKYEIQTQTSLNSHKDGTNLSFNIMLSDINDYEGGGTYFDDGLTYYLNPGDVLVHSGFINHGSHDITKGERYVLVVFFDIIEQFNSLQ